LRDGDCIRLATVTNEELVGKAESHLCSDADAHRVGARIHADVVAPFMQLHDDAAAAGFTLTILSGFRAFDRQLSIWNRKASGELSVLDGNARPLDISTMEDLDIALSILRWSALPGASRHHWGTDIDVYDAAAKPDGYEVDLVPAEVDAGGMFAPLHDWLDERIESGSACGFFRPYDADRGGIAPERWHLSYSPISMECTHLLTRELLRESLEQADMKLKDAVLDNLDEIVDRFVTNINPAFR
jgi:LAS superfamily LD-carboxypeptidase LdcB